MATQPVTRIDTSRDREFSLAAEIAQRKAAAKHLPVCLGFYITEIDSGESRFVLYDEVLELLELLRATAGI